MITFGDKSFIFDINLPFEPFFLTMFVNLLLMKQFFIYSKEILLPHFCSLLEMLKTLKFALLFEWNYYDKMHCSDL